MICFPHYTQVYCTTTSCPCQYFGKILKVHLNLVAPRIWWKYFCLWRIFTWHTEMSNIFGVGRGPQIYKNWTSNGGNNWGWCYKKWQECSFVSDYTREVRRQPACIYQNLMWYFSIHFSFSYSYVLYSASIYPVH